jgi:hypothetical protein
LITTEGRVGQVLKTLLQSVERLQEVALQVALTIGLRGSMDQKHVTREEREKESYNTGKKKKTKKVIPQRWRSGRCGR